MMPYIDNLPEQQRINFLHVLAHVMHADGIIEEAEAGYIRVAAKAYNIPSSHLDEVMSPATDEETIQLALTIQGDFSRRYMMREMIALAYADGVLDEKEKDVIFHIGNGLGVSDLRMNEMIEWAIDSFELQIDGISLVEEDDNGDETSIDDEDFDEETADNEIDSLIEKEGLEDEGED